MKLIRKILTTLAMFREYTHASILAMGFVIVVIFGTMALAYMNGHLVLEDGEVNLTITSAVTKWGGKIAYAYLGWALVFLISHATPYVLRFRNWWVHSESHKITREVYLYLRGL